MFLEENIGVNGTELEYVISDDDAHVKLTGQAHGAL